MAFAACDPADRSLLTPRGARRPQRG